MVNFAGFPLSAGSPRCIGVCGRSRSPSSGAKGRTLSSQRICCARSTVLHPDITALVIESSSGWARAAAAKSAAVALVAEVSAAGALGSLPSAILPSLRGALTQALANLPREKSRALLMGAIVADELPAI